MNFVAPLLTLVLASGIACAPAQALGAASPAADAIERDGVEQMISHGRDLLAVGKAPEAQAIFERAAEIDAQSPRTRQWVIRSWIPQRRVNDALDAIDGLAKEGVKGPSIDYLYGIAFAFKGREYIQQKVQGQIIDMAFSDAVDYLRKATDADPMLYKDAFVPLAEAAWYQQKLDIARVAADRAVEADPASGEAAMVLGKIALSQYVVTKEVESAKAEADGHWEAARSAFDHAATLYRANDARHTEAARALVELGHAYAWQQRLDEAARSYAEAAAYDPAAVDFGQMRSTLGPERFSSALESAATEFAHLHPDAGAEDAALVWWLGRARYDQNKYAEADEAFSRAVEKNPTFLNSWYYIALARYQQKDYDGAITALRRNWDADQNDLAASLASNLDVNLAILDSMVGWFVQHDRPFEAGVLSEMQATAAPTAARFWNNMGLFYRDAGEPLKQSDREEDRATAQGYFETAYRAYSNGLTASPDDPSILNDTAVMLHYYLHRDLERARELYKKATERATAELARTDLAADVRTIYQTALRDSKNNLALLEKGSDQRE